MAQPALPAEGTYGEIEQNFIENSPPGLWPDNQDSNFGQLRKVLLEPLQECSDKLTVLDLEMYAATAEIYLSLWEQELNLPIAPTGKTPQNRRDVIASKLVYGPFTRTRLNALIESFIVTTFGSAASLTPEGLALDAGGIPLFSGVSSLADAYRIYEDIRNYSFELWIKSAVTPDMSSLTRELTRIVPGGHSYTIDNTKTNVLDYARTVRNKQPNAFFRLGPDANDTSGYANHGTLNGTHALVSSPGLLAHTDVAGANGARDFDGASGYVSVPDAPQLDLGDHLTIEFLARPDAIGAVMRVVDKGANAYSVYINATGAVVFEQKGVGTIAASTINLVAGTIYYVEVKKSGPLVKILIDDVDRTGTVVNRTLVDTATALNIGRNVSGGEFFNGALDEVALYDLRLTADESTSNYKTAKNIA
jgi:hypothetical protein